MSTSDDMALLEARARRLARPLEDAQRNVSLTVLHHGSDRVGFRTEQVAAVLRSPKVVPLPSLPSLVRGLISHRGEPLPVFDLRALVGDPADAAIGALLVLTSPTHPPLALAADRVEELQLAEGQLRADRTIDGPFSSFVGAVGDDGFLVLDVERLLADPRFRISGSPGNP